MILQLLLQLLQSLFTIVLGWTSIVTLPFGIEGYLQTGAGYIHMIVVYFPPLGIMLQGFLWILVWKFIMILLRLIPFIGRIFNRN
jgi:hypothetical protein